MNVQSATALLEQTCKRPTRNVELARTTSMGHVCLDGSGARTVRVVRCVETTSITHRTMVLTIEHLVPNNSMHLLSGKLVVVIH